MNAPAAIGHNNPPDPIDEALAPYCDQIEEAQNWLDGEPVQTEDQMRAVDALAQALKDAKRDVDAARKAATDPLHKAWKAEVARWKPTEDDLTRMVKGLAACVEPLKLRIAAEKEAAKRAAWEEARRVQREAEAAARAAEEAASNIDAMRDADAAKARALEAEKAAQAASRDRQTGLRTVTETVVIDAVKLARHLWEHDRAAQLEFQADRARKLRLDIPGVVERRSEKRAF